MNSPAITCSLTQCPHPKLSIYGGHCVWDHCQNGLIKCPAAPHQCELLREKIIYTQFWEVHTYCWYDNCPSHFLDIYDTWQEALTQTIKLADHNRRYAGHPSEDYAKVEVHPMRFIIRREHA